MLGALIAILIFLLASGWVYQTVAERGDLKRYPPPGRLIDVGGRNLHLVCAGNGNTGPTVVIEAGSGDDSNQWRDVLNRVAAFAAVCSYDRAGLGWSDSAPAARTFADRAADFSRLIERAALRPPYILVGHSYGGYIVRLFARDHPGDVAGVVLVEASEEGFAFQPAALAAADKLRSRNLGRGVAARFGILHLVATPFPEQFRKIAGMPRHYPGPQALYLRADRYFETADEMAAYHKVPPAMTVPGGFGSLGGLPLTVISRADRDASTGEATDPSWLAGQARLLELSSNSLAVVASKSGHNVQDSEPGLIAEAIHRIWSAARS